MTDTQFKKMGEWFKKLNQKVGEVKSDLHQKVGEVKTDLGEVKSDLHSFHDKMNLKFERVYRDLDSIKVRLTDVEEHLEKYTDDERNEIKILRLALSKLEDRVSALSV